MRGYRLYNIKTPSLYSIEIRDGPIGMRIRSLSFFLRTNYCHLITIFLSRINISANDRPRLQTADRLHGTGLGGVAPPVWPVTKLKFGHRHHHHHLTKWKMNKSLDSKHSRFKGESE